MTNKVYPSRMPNPVTPLGYDDADFMAFGVVRETGMNVGTQKILRVDRNVVRINEAYTGTVGDHAWTERVTYSITSGHHAIIQLIGYGFGAVPANGQVRWRVLFEAAMIWAFVATDGIPLWNRYVHVPMSFEMLAGETLSMETYNDTGSNCFFAGQFIGIEFDD